MPKYKRYRVASLFAHNGVIMTNDHEEQIRALPAEVREHHVKLGNLEEYEADEPPVGATAATAKSTTKPTAKE